MDKERCAFDLDDRCKALKEKTCLGCTFYKTKKELDEGREKAAMVIENLPPKYRSDIRHKYYGGRRAFKDE